MDRGASRSRRASRTLPALPPRTTVALDAGLARPRPRRSTPAARAAIDGHVRLLLAWTRADQPDRDPRSGGGRDRATSSTA